MYYKSVNRGLNLTAPGFYTIALVLALGLLAIGSGYNAIYLSLSLGMAILIVSGILSERVIRHFQITEISSVMAEPKHPFVMHLKVENSSDTVTLYGVESSLYLAVPNFNFLQTKTEPLMKNIAVAIGPRGQTLIAGQCTGMQRGVYRKFFIVQRTIYPFGLLSKFKVSEQTGEVSVMPQFLDGFAREFRENFKRSITGKDQDREFHSHRSYTTKDSVRMINWRKSAGKSSDEWLVKEYESRVDDFGVWVQPDWGSILATPSEEQYEDAIAHLRTACEVIMQEGRKIVFLCPDQSLVSGFANILKFLVALSGYELREQRTSTDVSQFESGKYLAVSFDEHWNCHWSSSSTFLRYG